MVDSATTDDPLCFSLGDGTLIDALEQQLTHLAVGQSVDVTLSPEQAFGDVESNQLIWVEKNHPCLPSNLRVGQVIEMRTDHGSTAMATIAQVSNTRVELDFSHPLAGRSVRFKATRLT